METVLSRAVLTVFLGYLSGASMASRAGVYHLRQSHAFLLSHVNFEIYRNLRVYFDWHAVLVARLVTPLFHRL